MSQSRNYTTMESPVGPLVLAGDDAALTLIGFTTGPKAWSIDPGWVHVPTAFAVARGQLAEYFAGQREHFDLTLRPEGTEFQRAVWQALTRIPYGETCSYGDIAAAIGRPKAVRAVGAANGRNPLPIVVPCHRVIGSNGSLTGFGGGLENKERLLALEARGNA
ncbi:MAG: methylated-DNA--[protein]-cysteine S-methyltransferase [Pseudomonadota bacterium]